MLALKGAAGFGGSAWPRAAGGGSGGMAQRGGLGEDGFCRLGFCFGGLFGRFS